jgi:predicted  nucleic acid-binding Zn-ribbon protein
MTPNDVLNLLTSFQKRLTTIENQAREARDQAQHVLDRLGKLQNDLEGLVRKVVAMLDTGEHVPLSEGEEGLPTSSEKP